MAQDTPDLEALFDQIAAERKETVSEGQADNHSAGFDPLADMPEGVDSYDIFQRLGKMTRDLHDALRKLGFDKNVEDAVQSMPDARARLDYIANLTGRAAETVLAYVENGQRDLGVLEDEARDLSAQWERVFAKQASVEDFKRCAESTRAFLAGLPARSSQQSSVLTEIMMAQDFHDLTGQVVKKIGDIAQNVEAQLLKLLVEATPPNQRTHVEQGWLNGPVINPTGRQDVVTDQTQVDDLLASLGF